jgi:hypothetical protein
MIYPAIAITLNCLQVVSERGELLSSPTWKIRNLPHRHGQPGEGIRLSVLATARARLRYLEAEARCPPRFRADG